MCDKVSDKVRLAALDKNTKGMAEMFRVRQPLNKILLPVAGTGFKEILEPVRELILAEVNVKNIEYIDDASSNAHSRPLVYLARR